MGSYSQGGYDWVPLSGRVVDHLGTPVNNAEVGIVPLNGYAGMLPNAHTDKDGRFYFKVPPVGDGVITALDPTRGFPDAAIALYGKNEYRSWKRIAPKAGATEIEVELRFGEPDAVIDWQVRSERDNISVQGARYESPGQTIPKSTFLPRCPAQGYFSCFQSIPYPSRLPLLVSRIGLRKPARSLRDRYC